MNIINPKVTEVTDFEGTYNFYKSVARAARICYASDKTTDNIDLVKRLVKSKHYSPFAHAIIYIDVNRLREVKSKYDDVICSIIERCLPNKYTTEYKNGIYTVNGRVILECCEATLEENKDITLDTLDLTDYFLTNIKMVEINPSSVNANKSFIVDTSIGCTREMNRHHNNFNICEQSTRYCNFSKDKFGGEVAFNKPYWFDDVSTTTQQAWMTSMELAEKNYFDLQSLGMTTDEARGVLPIDTHSRAIYTATIQEWRHVIDLRLKGTTGKPHGDIAIIAGMINEMIN